MKMVPLPDWSAQGDAELAQAIAGNVQLVFHGRHPQIELALATLMSGCHLLIDGVPGVGKTLFARALAISAGLDYQRVPLYGDMLPVERMYAIARQEQAVHAGKAQVQEKMVICDGLHAAAGAVQAALLQTMEEVSIQDRRKSLQAAVPALFVVTRTLHGGRELHPLIMELGDRFGARIELGYPGLTAETQLLLEQQLGSVIPHLKAVGDLQKFARLMAGIFSVVLSKDMAMLIAGVVAATRSHTGLLQGASPRAAQVLARMARALSYVRGMPVVTPAIVHELVMPVLGHRLVVRSQNGVAGRSVEDILREILALQQVTG